MPKDRPETPPPAPYLPPPEPEAAGGSAGPLQALLRRWPLVVVGLLVGLGCGVLIHVTSTRVYQSTAQLLVVKTRDSGPAQEARSGVVDDYVQAQIVYIRSEKIRREAVGVLRKKGVPTGLSEDEGVAAAQLLAGLEVTKDRDSGGPTVVNNGIVNLSFRGTDPRDTELYLAAIIEAYQANLSVIYGTSTQKLIEQLDRTVEVLTNNRKADGEALLKSQTELAEITGEDLLTIRSRVSSYKEREYKLSSELARHENVLKAIKEAGPNRRDRIAAYVQITGRTRGAAEGFTSGPEQNLLALELERSSLAEKLGKDHPQMKQINAQIEFERRREAEQNPGDADGRPSDELSRLELFTQFEAADARSQLLAVQSRLAEDQKVLAEAGRIEARIKQLADQMAQIDLNIRKTETEKQIISAGKASGGFEATAITPPHYGVQVAPVPVRSLLVGLVLGGLIAAAAVAAAELSDRSFRTPAEIRRRLGVPVIGHIPVINTEKPADAGTPENLNPALVAALRPKSNEAETYRGVRTQLYFSTQGREHQVIQVTSPNPGDGKSTLAANLAVVIAQSGKSVVLLDCDFRKPQVHKIFGLGKVEAGLADVVAGSATVAKATRRSPVKNLDLIPCGTRPNNPAELLTSPRFQELLQDLRASYDFVVVDTPPVLAVSDPGNVAARVDGVLLVFRMTKNSRPAAERAYESLAALGANVLGVVVNAGTGGRGYGDYNYGSRYGYRYTDYQYADSYAEAADEADAPAVAGRS